MGYLNYELDNDEKLIAIIRKHLAVLAVPFSKVIIAIMVVVLIYGKIAEFKYGLHLSFLWIISSILYGVYEIMVWYLDCYLITNKRIIDIDQKGAFKRTVAEVGIENIQEAIYEINGPLEALLDYGTVKIKMASSGSMISMEQIPNPAEIKKIIIETQKNRKALENGSFITKN